MYHYNEAIKNYVSFLLPNDEANAIFITKTSSFSKIENIQVLNLIGCGTKIGQ